jgi:DNA-(apurinic or apyrimidinic site) lyase
MFLSIASFLNEADWMSVGEFGINFERVKVVANLFNGLGFERIVKFDMLEPEYHALRTLRDRGVRPEYSSLIAVCTGVIDFQLGRGGAEKLWATLAEVANRFDELNSLKQVEFLMKVFLSEPINARSLQLKIARIRKLFDSEFAEWFIENYEGVRQSPVVLWRRLAETLGSGMEQKTMVFAMKAFDISHLLYYGDYVDFPWDIPIPVDFHVRHVTISAGLLDRYGDDEAFRKVWALVLRKVREKLGRNVSLLRLDSLVWQVGKMMYACNYAKTSSLKEIQRYLTQKVGVDPVLANKFADELTKFIKKVNVNYEKVRNLSGRLSISTAKSHGKIKKLMSIKELNKARLQGGYIINIDPAGIVIHTSNCRWIRRMKPQKVEGGTFYSESHQDVVNWLKASYSKFKECNTCLSGREYKSS